jgi:hypothetical protein
MLLDFIVDCTKGCTKVLDGLDGRCLLLGGALRQRHPELSDLLAKLPPVARHFTIRECGGVGAP